MKSQASSPTSSPRSTTSARTWALEVDATRCTALHCARSAGRLTVLGVHDFAVGPVGVAADELAACGVTRAHALLSLARDGALLGSIELPTDDEADLRSMARMTIARDYSPEGVVSVGDFQIAQRTLSSTVVLVAAAARSALDTALSRIGGAASRVSLRTLGTVALIRASNSFRVGATLVVDVTQSSVEFTLVRDGVLANSRSAEVRGTSVEERAASLGAEFRRLLLALRGGAQPAANEHDAANPIDRVVVFAERTLSARVMPEFARVSSCSVTRLESHAHVDASNPDSREAFVASCWPLAGLLLEDEAALKSNGTAIDLLHPTQLIDVAARARQRSLLVAGVVVIASLAGWTLGARSWRDLEERRDDLQAKARTALPELRSYKRDELRLKHIDAYSALAPTWLSHLDTLRRFAPDPHVVVLDGMTAQLISTDVEYTDAKFVTHPELRFVIDGEAKDRGVADALRDTLVKEKGYTLGSTGADARGGRRLPAPFAYTLRTSDLTPRESGEVGDAAATPKAVTP